MTWLVVLAVGVGAGLGAQLRLAAERLHSAARERHGLGPAELEWSTLVVNAIGSGALGALVGALEVGAIDAAWFAVGGAGVCGGLTTFSTLAVDVVTLARAGRWVRAAGYVLAHVVLGLGLFALGLALVAG